MHAADELPGFRPGTGLTIVSWLLRVGFLVSPPIVGAIADPSSLRLGPLVVPAAGLFVMVASSVLSGRVARSADNEPAERQTAVDHPHGSDHALR